jgi:hypothetical protein
MNVDQRVTHLLLAAGQADDTMHRFQAGTLPK